MAGYCTINTLQINFHLNAKCQLVQEPNTTSQLMHIDSKAKSILLPMNASINLVIGVLTEGHTGRKNVASSGSKVAVKLFRRLRRHPGCVTVATAALKEILTDKLHSHR